MTSMAQILLKSINCSGASEAAAMLIARACCMKLLEGASQDEVRKHDASSPIASVVCFPFPSGPFFQFFQYI